MVDSKQHLRQKSIKSFFTKPHTGDSATLPCSSSPEECRNDLSSSSQLCSPRSSAVSARHRMQASNAQSKLNLLSDNEESSSSSSEQSSSESDEEVDEEDSEEDSDYMNQNNSILRTDLSSSLKSVKQLQHQLKKTSDKRRKASGTEVTQPSCDETKSTIKRILEEYLWKGPPPDAITSMQRSILSNFDTRKACFLCKNTSNALRVRVPSTKHDLEEAFLAHLILTHWDNEDARCIVDRKRYELSELGLNEDTLPFIFRLQPVTKKALDCSACNGTNPKSFSKLSNLRIHWKSCARNASAMNKETVTRGDKTFARVPGSSRRALVEDPKTRGVVRCILGECVSGWRPSEHYSNDVSIAAHLLFQHTMDENAEKLGCDIADRLNMAQVFPFIDLRKSFATSKSIIRDESENGEQNRLKKENSVLLCSECEKSSPNIYLATRHAIRYHLTKEEKREKGYIKKLECALGCTYKTMGGFSKEVLLTIHYITSHLDREGIRQLKEIDSDAVASDPLLPLNISQSITLSKQNGCPTFFCDECEVSIPRSSLLRHSSKWHRETNCDHLDSTCSESESGSKSKSSGRGEWNAENFCCPYCSIKMFESTRYDRLCVLACHVINSHRNEENIIKDFRETSDLTSISLSFPFLDFQRSLELSKNEERTRLCCSKCDVSVMDNSSLCRHSNRIHSIKCPKPTTSSKRILNEENTEDEQLRPPSKKHKSSASSDQLVDRIKTEEEKTLMPSSPHVTMNVRSLLHNTLRQSIDVQLSSGKSASPCTSSIADIVVKEAPAFTASPGTLLDALNGSSIQSESSLNPRPVTTCSPGSQSRRKPFLTKPKDLSMVPDADGVRCSQCSFMGSTTDCLRRHYYDSHSESYLDHGLSGPGRVSMARVETVCAVCREVFVNRKALEAHAKSEHPQDKCFGCRYCLSVFHTILRVREHERRMHESAILLDKDDLKCVHCKMQFTTKRNRDLHIKRHSDPRSTVGSF